MRKTFIRTRIYWFWTSITTGNLLAGHILLGCSLDIGFAIDVASKSRLATARPASSRCRHHRRHRCSQRARAVTNTIAVATVCELACQRLLTIAAAGLLSPPSPLLQLAGPRPQVAGKHILHGTGWQPRVWTKIEGDLGKIERGLGKERGGLGKDRGGLGKDGGKERRGLDKDVGSGQRKGVVLAKLEGARSNSVGGSEQRWTRRGIWAKMVGV